MCTHTFEMYCKMLFLPASPLLKRQNRMADVSRLMRVERVVSEQPAVDVRHHCLQLVGKQKNKNEGRGPLTLASARSCIPSLDLPVAFCVSLLIIQAAWTAEMNWHSGLRGMGAEFFIKASNSMRGVYLDAQLTPSWQRPTQHRLLSDICGAKCVGVVSARLRLAKSHSSVVAKGWASSEPEGTKKATTSCAREFPHHSQ